MTNPHPADLLYVFDFSHDKIEKDIQHSGTFPFLTMDFFVSFCFLCGLNSMYC